MILFLTSLNAAEAAHSTPTAHHHALSADQLKEISTTLEQRAEDKGKWLFEVHPNHVNVTILEWGIIHKLKLLEESGLAPYIRNLHIDLRASEFFVAYGVLEHSIKFYVKHNKTLQDFLIEDKDNYIAKTPSHLEWWDIFYIKNIHERFFNPHTPLFSILKLLESISPLAQEINPKTGEQLIGVAISEEVFTLIEKHPDIKHKIEEKWEISGPEVNLDNDRTLTYRTDQ